MNQHHSTLAKLYAKRKQKPRRPPGFPLFCHSNGQWAKKVRGKLVYFGKVADDPTGIKARDLWLEQRDDLLAGRKPRPKGGDGLTIQTLVNTFLTAKLRAREAGELAQRTYDDYYAVAERVVKHFGLTRLVDDINAGDFEAFRAAFAKSLGPVSVAGIIQRVRIIFKYGYDQGLIDKPVRYGQGFNKPSAKVIRKVRAERGPLLFTRNQVRAMLEAASVPMRAMILLGVNCGFGNQDCATLPQSAIDWKGGWINYPRPKTGIERRCKLWKETLSALRAAIDARPNPKNETHGGLVFVTSRGLTWSKERDDNPVAKELRKIVVELGIHRKGIGFYTLRRTFATVASGSLDQPAVDHIMGHSPSANDMAAIYRQAIDDRRLVAVAKYVRAWLFGKGGAR